MNFQILLVRHGQAAAAWNTDPDPGLSEAGSQQALAVRDALASMAPVPVFSSPLRRAQETAVPLATAWQIPVQIDTHIVEIPSPAGLSLAERLQWLYSIRDVRWPQASDDLLRWRETLLSRMQQIQQPCVLVTHFMVMNLVAGMASGDDRLVHYQPANGSILTLSRQQDAWRIDDWGTQADTRVL